jgi:hypothetical protein
MSVADSRRAKKRLQQRYGRAQKVKLEALREEARRKGKK